MPAQHQAHVSGVHSLASFLCAFWAAFCAPTVPAQHKLWVAGTMQGILSTSMPVWHQVPLGSLQCTLGTQHRVPILGHPVSVKPSV